MTISQAAQYLRCSEAHLVKLMDGPVPESPILACVSRGNRITIRKKALHEWLYDLAAFQRQEAIRRHQAQPLAATGS